MRCEAARLRCEAVSVTATATINSLGKKLKPGNRADPQNRGQTVATYDLPLCSDAFRV
jgi:hypothetical protein